MIVVMKIDHSKEQSDAVMNRLAEFGLKGQPVFGVMIFRAVERLQFRVRPVRRFARTTFHR